jgi:uncharacterized protein (TIGR03083 family)
MAAILAPLGLVSLRSSVAPLAASSSRRYGARVTEPMIDLLAEVWSSIVAVCRDLDEEQWLLATECPGWTVKDNVAHMIGTERMLLGDQQPEVDIAGAAHVRNDIGTLNERWIEPLRGVKGSDVLTQFEDVTQRRIAALRALEADAWNEEGFTPEGPGPYRQFMAIRVFDCWFHEQDIREALDQPGNLEGNVADHSIERIQRGLPYVVGKKAGAPQGATVVFDIVGTRRMTVPVGVDGRAHVLELAPADPTVRLTMDRRTYARLAGGRWPGQRVLDEKRVTIDGDQALGETIVAQMAFTI